MDHEIRLFHLNIEEVLEHWSIADAIREVLANALDEQVLTHTNPPEIYKDSHNVWHIRDFGRGLKYEHLTQNENHEKLNNLGLVIGKFGMGLKDAFATFDRHHIRASIVSKCGDIQVIKATKHGFTDIKTLHATITTPSDREFIGTDFALDGIADADMATAKSYFLQFNGDEVLETTPYGSVIRNEIYRKAKIYVSGLCVGEEENFLFSYNITSPNAILRKALNRERTNLGRSAYTDRVKAILLACKSVVVAQALANELKNFEQGTMCDELNWNDIGTHASQILNAAGDVIFLTPEQLREGGSLVTHAQDDGKRVIVVPENIASRFGNLRDVEGNPMSGLDTYRQEWNNSFQLHYVNFSDLTPEERTIFLYQDQIFTLVDSDATWIKAIKISETMRLNKFNNDMAVGVWIPEDQTIVIRRDQLKTIDQFAGTLLHELVHAITGTDDRSIDFESELTQLLGKLFKMMIDAEPAHRRGLSPLNINNFAVGERVCHPLLGWGTLMDIRGEGDQAELMVAFIHGGVRSFQAQFAQLSHREIGEHNVD